MPLLTTAEGETPQDLAFPDNFTDGDGNQWVHCAVQTDPTAVEYKRVVEPNTNEVISV